MKKVNDKLWIAQQPHEADIRNAAERGFTTIINNRPDHEEPGQPTAAANARVAGASGLGFAHIPVRHGGIDEAQVREFQKALDEAEGPVLAHCRSGMRSLTLWAIGEVLDGRMTREEVAQVGRRLGMDLSGAQAWLDDNS